MSREDELRRNYVSHAQQALRPIAQELGQKLAITADDPEALVLGAALARAYMAGVAAAQNEMVAQAIQEGIDVKIEILGGLEGEGDNS